MSGPNKIEEAIVKRMEAVLKKYREEVDVKTVPQRAQVTSGKHGDKKKVGPPPLGKLSSPQPVTIAMILPPETRKTSNSVVNKFHGTTRVAAEGTSKESTPISSGAAVRLVLSSPTQGRTPCGFTNVGYSCYINSVLQALFHVPLFLDWMVGQNVHKEMCQSYKEGGSTSRQCVFCAMSYTYEATKMSPQSGQFTPLLILNLLDDIGPGFTPGIQQDVAEFLMELLRSMEAAFVAPIGGLELDTNGVDTATSRIFGGYLQSLVSCSGCGATNGTYEEFIDIRLDLLGFTCVAEGLAAFFKNQSVDRQCEDCHEPKATRRYWLEVPPAVLCLHLIGFTGGPNSAKILQPYLCNPGLSLGKFVHRPVENADKQVVRYKLQSTICHYGTSIESGHYIAFGRAQNGKFHKFDDGRVTAVSTDEASSHEGAYFVFYNRV